MEETISSFSKTLASFCNHLESSCDALKHSIDRRPIPLDSASSTFIQCLNRRVSSASSDLNLLESMSFGTVSFEELLGHCNEVYKKNQNDLAQLEEHLKSVGCVPEIDVDDEIDNLTDLSEDASHLNFSCSEDGLNLSSSHQRHISATGSFIRNLEADALFDESLSLENIGLSDVCLATLASEGNGKIVDSEMALHEPMKFLEKPIDLKVPCQPNSKTIGVFEGRKLVEFEEVEDNQKLVEAASSVIKLSKDDFESLPSYMKGLASWEDLIVAVEKINSSLKQKTKGKDFIRQDEISSLDLGPKARSYLLLLVRLKHLVVETIDGLISYRVL